MADQFTPIPVNGKRTNNNAAPATDQVAVMPALANAAAPSFTEGNQVLQSVDLAGNARSTLMRLGANAVSVGSGTVDNGTLRVSPATDVVQRVSKDGSANSVTDPLWTQLTDGTAALGTAGNPLITETGGVTNAKDSGLLTTVAVAAGGSTTLTAAALSANKAGKLLEVDASSSVRLKVQIQTVSSGGSPTTTTVRTFMVEAYQSLQYKPTTKDLITIAAAASSTGKFQVVLTNEDPSNAADVYASIGWDEE